MANRDGKLRFGVGIQGGGAHWRAPGKPADGAVRIETYMEYAKIAESGLFDFGFIADSTYISKDSPYDFLARMEPLAALSAVSAVTRHIGLVGTFSTSYSFPFTTARQLASLDMVSGGRAGWNAVTSAYEEVARNYNGEKLYDHGLRYEMADEYLEVCKGLWDSFEEGAFVRDKESGVFIDWDKMHTLDHKGTHYQVQGPLNMQRTPQGRPIIFQAGASDAGRNLAAKHADAIFSTLTESDDIPSMIAYAQDMTRRMEACGRSRDDILIFPSAAPIVGSTQAEADAKYEKEASYGDLDSSIRLMSRYFNFHDFTQYALDEPLPDLSGIGSGGFKSITEYLAGIAREERLTLRQLAYRAGFPKGWFVGPPEAIADRMEQHMKERVVDGYILFATHANLQDFIEHVVPILQKRGLFREEYEGATLRENLGLDMPRNRYAAG